MSLDKNYSPQDFEQKIYEKEQVFFVAKSDPNKEPYCIMMPPPNVTGSLHLGHALTYTIQDILIRFKRMCGYDVLWQPGTDHAGIATQMVVERQLSQENLSRHDLGRDAFIERVWQWKEHSGNTIVEQQKRLGISTDWSRARFTMDEGLSKAVQKVFVKLHQDGLIYRAKRLVNWDTKLHTAISDLEVNNVESQSGFWHILYKLADDTNQGIVIATTRPETLFGDTAVAVHPDDERYQGLIGKMLHHPLTGRMIPIIADDYCDPTKGSGAVKITPAHDFNDFAVGKRHHLEMINILTQDGLLNENVPGNYQGLDVREARKIVLRDLEEQGLLVKSETINNTTPISERTGVEVQPWLTDQWFVDAKVLAEPALKAVQEGTTKLFPEQWDSTYFEWLNNIQPWCISRQIWWGHQIPAWYGPDGEIFVAENEDEAYAQARERHGEDVKLTRDQDVLDTWFSSALWPFSTLGWPENTKELAHYYPTSVLVTGFDIIFFWVARMMMMGLYFIGKVPFETVYIHALVRDEKGQKMSKSKGNIIDPLELINSYGADALRFTLATLAVPGRDVKLGAARVESNRNFITKIWNASRFLQMNECAHNPQFDYKKVSHPLNQWIIQNLIETARTAQHHLNSYRFDLAAQCLYQFMWGTFCDIYVECVKPILASESSEIAKETRECSIWVLLEYLKLLHPIAPFVSQHLWQSFNSQESKMLINEQWPDYDELSWNSSSIKELIEFVESIRSYRGLLGIQPNVKIQAYFIGGENFWKNIQINQAWVCHLARLSSIECAISKEAKQQQDVVLSVGHHFVMLRLESLSQHTELQVLLQKKAQLIQSDLDKLQKKLENQAYKTAKPDQWKEDSVSFEYKKGELKKIMEISL